MTESTVLQQIAGKVRQRLAERQKERPFAQLENELKGLHRIVHDFYGPFGEEGVHIIAEVKRASPTRANIALNLDPLMVAEAYLKNGARALSVLTEQDYFLGDPSYLQSIRLKFPHARLLMKDFMLEPYQILEAKVLGADAVLLIVALLGEQGTQELFEVAKEQQLSCLVEVHDERELEVALAMGAPLIGINNRNLKTLQISLDTTRQLLPRIPKDRLVIVESGLKGGDELREFRGLGCHGFLIGTSLMETGKPGEALRQLLRDAHES